MLTYKTTREGTRPEIVIPPLLIVKQHLSKQSQIEHGTWNGITVETVLTDLCLCSNFDVEIKEWSHSLAPV